MIQTFFARQNENSIVWAAVLIACGISFYFSLSFEPDLVWPTALLFVCLSFAFTLRIHFLRTAFLIVLLFLSGFTASAIRTEYKSTVMLEKEIRYSTMTGVVESMEKRPNGIRLIIEPKIIDRIRNGDPLPSRLQITTRHMQNVQWHDLPGSSVFLTASLISPSPPVIHGAYDFARHAYFKGIGGYGYTVGESYIIENNTEFTLNFGRLRSSLAQDVFENMNEQTGGIAATLLTGSRGAVTDQAYNAFKAAGLAHLLSISGMHVGMVAGFLFYVSRLVFSGIPSLSLRYPVKKWAAVFAMLGAFGYTLMVGAPVPTQRAFIMTAIALFAIIVDRSPVSMRLVAVAGIILLLIQPESLLGPSFQMSFAAVVALIAFYDSTRSFWQRLWREGGQHFHKRILIYLYGVTATTIIATLATSLFAVFHFGQLAPYSIFGNLIAMPIMAVFVMPFVVMTYFLIPIGLESLSFWVIDKALSAILFIATQIDTIPYALYPLPYMPVSVLLWFVAGGSILCFIKGRERIVGLLPLIIGIFLYIQAPLPDIVITRGMTIIGIRQNNDMILVERKSDSFARDMISTVYAGQIKHVNPRTDNACDVWGCTFQANHKIISVALTPEAVAEDCKRADILISREPVEQECDAQTIDWWDIWRGGGMTGYLDLGELKAIYVNDTRSDRPWVQ